jgi:hypothetical protein
LRCIEFITLCVRKPKKGSRDEKRVEVDKT